MKIKILTVGRPKSSFIRVGFADYLARLQKFRPLEVKHFKDSSKDLEILKFIKNDFLVILDEKGQEFSSQSLAKFLNKQEIFGHKNISFFIGGPDGHSPTIKERANFSWSLSKLTLPHELALLVLTEALYRAYTINQNLPYHRA